MEMFELKKTVSELVKSMWLSGLLNPPTTGYQLIHLFQSCLGILVSRVQP
jgi:hypothetical protein